MSKETINTDELHALVNAASELISAANNAYNIPGNTGKEVVELCLKKAGAVLNTIPVKS